MICAIRRSGNRRASSGDFHQTYLGASNLRKADALTFSGFDLSMSFPVLEVRV
jgi:hypothetical protein